MKVLILGAGAIGSFIGARLSLVCDVVLFTRNKEHIKAIRERGLVVKELSGEEKTFWLKSASKLDEIDFVPDLVLVLVKTYDTEGAVNSIKGIVGEDTQFLTLQNGIGNVERIARFVDKERIIAGTTSLGSALIKPGFIKHGGYGPTYIGRPSGRIDQIVLEVVDLFNKAGLQAKAVVDVERYIWKKLLVNTGINAITAIAKVKNGWIYKDPNAKAIAEEAVIEGVRVAERLGLEFEGDMVESMLSVAKATEENISSMHQDILKSRKTEIDAINGAIVEYGERLGISTPVNKTLTRLIKLIENKNRSEPN